MGTSEFIGTMVPYIIIYIIVMIWLRKGRKNEKKKETC